MVPSTSFGAAYPQTWVCCWSPVRSHWVWPSLAWEPGPWECTLLLVWSLQTASHIHNSIVTLLCIPWGSNPAQLTGNLDDWEFRWLALHLINSVLLLSVPSFARSLIDCFDLCMERVKAEFLAPRFCGVRCWRHRMSTPEPFIPFCSLSYGTAVLGRCNFSFVQLFALRRTHVANR
jgi:hypothetical protein